MLEKGLLGNTIRSARIKSGLSQEELAEHVGITPTHLKHIESEHRKPSIDVFIALIETLHFSADELIFPSKDADSSLLNNTLAAVKTCSPNELAIINDLILSLKKHSNM